MAADFDVVILGGGMGGYPAAIRASQLGLKVALVESDKLGGTCLHIGCIPTKALLESSELYHRVAARGAEFGLKAEVVGYDYPRIAERRDAVVSQLYKGVQYLMKKNKIEVVQGKGRVRDRNTIEVGSRQLKAKQLLVAVGRAAVSKELGLEQAGVQMHPNGFIKVDEWMRTSVDSIHAIGDVVGGYLLAHAASHEGIVAAEDIAGQRLAPMEQELITRCTYSHPQVASVGMTEKQARDRGHEVKVGRFPFSAIGRAQIHGETAGFVKIVADAKSGQLLGTHIVGANATELIAEPALTQLFQGDAWELGRNIHPHPTLSEAVMEAAMAVDGHAIHF